MTFFNYFSDKQKNDIHEASLRILEYTGMFVKNSKAVQLFKKHGCLVDGQLVRFPEKMVVDKIKMAPSVFKFHGRDPKYDLAIPFNRPIISTASTAPYIVDQATGEYRRSLSADIANIACLINSLPAYDVFSISVLADDAPPDMRALYRFYPAIKNCQKPIRSHTSTVAELKSVLELGYIMAGGKAAYHERPFLHHHYCPIISPMVFDTEPTEAMIYLAQEGLPVYGTMAPSAGLSAPMSLLSTLTLGNAQFLALTFLLQAVREGTPVIYSAQSTVGDMRNGDYTSGGSESGILQIGHAEMARYYGVPSGGYIGLTNSHVNDIQSGYETAMNTTAAILGGTDFLNMGGLLGGLLAFDFDKAVLDHEIALRLKMFNAGFSIGAGDSGADPLAGLDLKWVDHDRGPRLQVSDQPARAENAFELLRRKYSDKFLTRPALERAHKIAVELLTQPDSGTMNPEIDNMIRRRISNLPSAEIGLHNAD